MSGYLKKSLEFVFLWTLGLTGITVTFHKCVISNLVFPSDLLFWLWLLSCLATAILGLVAGGLHRLLDLKHFNLHMLVMYAIFLLVPRNFNIKELLQNLISAISLGTLSFWQNKLELGLPIGLVAFLIGAWLGKGLVSGLRGSPNNY